MADRRLIIRSQVAPDYVLSATGAKNIQHLLSDWFPRTVYYDLTPPTARVDVVISRHFTGRAVFKVTFYTADGVFIKKMEYAEERMIGNVCTAYQRDLSRYNGNYDGFDNRRVIYSEPVAAA